MAGRRAYGAFADGRYFMTRRILELSDWLKLRLQLLPPKEAALPKPQK
jgi:hypothetical protein